MSAHVIVRSDRGPDPDLVDELSELGVATVHEAMGRRGLVSPALRPIYPGARIAGRAVTVLSHPGDNLMIHASIAHCRPGDVLVVATTSPSTDGMFGELFATQLRFRGVRGLVIDAGVRDVADLTAMGFPVWSRAICAQGTVKATPGSVNVPVVVGGAVVSPGDVVVADDDGVLIVPLERSDEIALAARARAEKEAHARARFAEGVSSLELYDLAAVLERLGVRSVEPGDEPAPAEEAARR